MQKNKSKSSPKRTPRISNTPTAKQPSRVPSILALGAAGLVITTLGLDIDPVEAVSKVGHCLREHSDYVVEVTVIAILAAGKSLLERR